MSGFFLIPINILLPQPPKEIFGRPFSPQTVYVGNTLTESDYSLIGRNFQT